MAGALLKYNGQALQTPSGAYGINNLVPENVKSGVNIGGVVGNYSGATPKLYRTTKNGGGPYMTISVPSKPIYVFLTIVGNNNTSNVIRTGMIKDINSDVIELKWGQYFDNIDGTLTYDDNAKTLVIYTTDSSHNFQSGKTYTIDILYYE